MASEISHELCQDCLNKKSCDYIPDGGKLIRCLDKRTAQTPEAGGNPQGASKSEKVLTSP